MIVLTLADEDSADRYIGATAVEREFVRAMLMVGMLMDPARRSCGRHEAAQGNRLGDRPASRYSRQLMLPFDASIREAAMCCRADRRILHAVHRQGALAMRSRLLLSISAIISLIMMTGTYVLVTAFA